MIPLTAGGSVLAWTIPPAVDPEPADGWEASEVEVRRLTDELEVVCRPESIHLEVVPPGVSRIHLQFASRQAAFAAFEAARRCVWARAGIGCRVVASTPMPDG